MNKVKSVNLFTTATFPGVTPTENEAEALLAHADAVIELRVQTPYDSTQDLETYAKRIANVAGRTLLSTRQADWHKPVPFCHSNYQVGSIEWFRSVEIEQTKLAEAIANRFKIHDSLLVRLIEDAEISLRRNRFGNPKRPQVVSRIAAFDRLLPINKALWPLHEFPGMTEITLLPDATMGTRAGHHPITAMFATQPAMTLTHRVLGAFADGKTPFQVAWDIIYPKMDYEQSVALRQHSAVRGDNYSALWGKVATQRGYGDTIQPFRPCVCRAEEPKPQDMREAAQRWIARIKDTAPHLPECHQRGIDVMMYYSDLALAKNRLADAIGDRHRWIAYHRLHLSKLEKRQEAQD